MNAIAMKEVVQKLDAAGVPWTSVTNSGITWSLVAHQESYSPFYQWAENLKRAGIQMVSGSLTPKTGGVTCQLKFMLEKPLGVGTLVEIPLGQRVLPVIGIQPGWVAVNISSTDKLMKKWYRSTDVVNF